MLSNTRYRYQELDALRGIAALMVITFHSSMHKPAGDVFFKFGLTGVDLFFMISGFVIFMSLNKISQSVEFVINRVSRLYPTYWICVTFTTVILIIHSAFVDGPRPGLVQYLANLTMFQFYMEVPNIDDVYWTMVVEMSFYIGVLFLFHFRLLKYLSGLGLSISILIILIFSLLDKPVIPSKIVYWLPILKSLPLFISGSVFYKILQKHGDKTGEYALIVVCLICQILLNYLLGSRVFITAFEYTTMIIIYFILFTLFANNKLNFIVSKTTLFFGKISFSLYLLHFFFSYTGMSILTEDLNLNFWLAFITVIIISIMMAYLVTSFADPLSIRLRQKLQAAFSLKVRA